MYITTLNGDSICSIGLVLQKKIKFYSGPSEITLRFRVLTESGEIFKIGCDCRDERLANS